MNLSVSGGNKELHGMQYCIEDIRIKEECSTFDERAMSECECEELLLGKFDCYLFN